MLVALWIGGAEWVVLGIRSAWLDGRRWTVLPVINFERLSMAILGGEPFQHPAGNGTSCTSFWDNTSER